MKQLFKPIPLALTCFSLWLTCVCASLLEFTESGDVIARSYSVWGDWSAHFTFISAFRSQGLAWMWGDNPVFSGFPFQYPFLSHLLTYLFQVISTLGTIEATYVLSLILIAILPFFIFRFYRSLGLNALSALLSVVAFLALGGLQWWDENLNRSEPLTNQFNQASVVTQVVLFELFPQRAFLFAIIGFCLIFTSLLSPKSKTLKNKILLACGIACLALTHIHTWLVAALLLLLLFLMKPKSLTTMGSRLDLFKFGVAAAGLSFLFLGPLLLRSRNADLAMSWTVFAPFWAQGEGAGLREAREMNVLWFWIYNTGIFLPLAGFGSFFHRKNPLLRILSTTGFLVFLLASLFQFQPYFYDNLKLYTVAFLLLAPFVGLALDQIHGLPFRPRWLLSGIAVIVLLFQTTTALVEFEQFRGGFQKALFFSKVEQTLAKEFQSIRTRGDALVLINPKHNHWVPCLSGSPVVMGYPGWLWSWGIRYQAREAEVQSILLGLPEALANLTKLKVEYVIVHDSDRIRDQPPNFAFLDQALSKLKTEAGWSIYQVKSPH